MPIKLLIADDAPFILHLLSEMITGFDMEVVAQARNGVEAVELAISKKPDVIFMDIVMPEKNGIEATQEILQKLPDVKVIGFSTLDDDHIKQKALDAGCISFVTKPFTRESVRDAIDMAMSL